MKSDSHQAHRFQATPVKGNKATNKLAKEAENLLTSDRGSLCQLQAKNNGMALGQAAAHGIQVDRNSGGFQHLAVCGSFGRFWSGFSEALFTSFFNKGEGCERLSPVYTRRTRWLWRLMSSGLLEALLGRMGTVSFRGTDKVPGSQTLRKKAKPWPHTDENVFCFDYGGCANMCIKKAYQKIHPQYLLEMRDAFQESAKTFVDCQPHAHVVWDGFCCRFRGLFETPVLRGLLVHTLQVIRPLRLHTCAMGLHRCDRPTDGHPLIAQGPLRWLVPLRQLHGTRALEETKKHI